MKQLELDFTQSGINRNNGIEVSAMNAEAKHPGWTDEALKWLVAFMARKDKFMAEEVRVFAEENGFNHPEHKRAWGGVMLKAARRGMIRRFDYGQTSNPKAHRANATIWERA